MALHVERIERDRSPAKPDRFVQAAKAPGHHCRGEQRPPRFPAPTPARAASMHPHPTNPSRTPSERARAPRVPRRDSAPTRAHVLLPRERVDTPLRTASNPDPASIVWAYASAAHANAYSGSRLTACREILDSGRYALPVSGELPAIDPAGTADTPPHSSRAPSRRPALPPSPRRSPTNPASLPGAPIAALSPPTARCRPAPRRCPPARGRTCPTTDASQWPPGRAAR